MTLQLDTSTWSDVFARIGAGGLERTRTRTLPYEQVALLAESGFTALRVPAEAGGRGLSLREFFELFIDLATEDAQVAHILRGHIAFVEAQRNREESAARNEWFGRILAGDLVGNAATETGTGDSLGTVLAPSGDGFVLNGVKFYTTGSIFADWIDVFAREEGSERLVGLLVSTHQDGVASADDWPGFGQQLTGSGTTRFTDAAVRPEHVFDLEEYFADFHYLDAIYQAVLVGLQAGLLRSLARRTAELVRARTRAYSHGNGDSARRDPQVLQVVGEIAASAQAATALVLDLAARMDEVAVHGSDGIEEAKASLQIAAANTQVVVTKLVLESTTRLFDALGASATSQDLGLDLYWRNARTIASHNPWIYKARISGDWSVNGVEPPYFWLSRETAQPGS